MFIIILSEENIEQEEDLTESTETQRNICRSPKMLLLVKVLFLVLGNEEMLNLPIPDKKCCQRRNVMFKI